MSRRIVLLLLAVVFCPPPANTFQLYSSSFAVPCSSGWSTSSSNSQASRSPTSAAAAAPAAAPAAATGQVDVFLVKKLRQITAAGYGSCVKALQYSDGDLTKAVQWLRQQGAADAAAAAAAAAAASNRAGEDEQQQGIVALSRLDTTRGAAAAAAAITVTTTTTEATAEAAGIERVAAVQVGCSSDFVSRSGVFTAAAQRAAAAAVESEAFAAAARAAAAAVAAADSKAEVVQQQQQMMLKQLLSLRAQGPADAASYDASTPQAEANVEEDLAYTSRIVGEKVVLKRVALLQARKGAGIVASYCHQPLGVDVAPMAVLLQLSYTRKQQQQQQGEVEERLRQFGRQLCMHIAATRPLAIRVEDLPPALVAQERQFALDSLSSSSSKSSSRSKGMPDALKQKIVEGKMSKWHKEAVLLKQPWALDDSGKATEKKITEVGQLLNATIKVEAFDVVEATPRG